MITEAWAGFRPVGTGDKDNMFLEQVQGVTAQVERENIFQLDKEFHDGSEIWVMKKKQEKKL